MQTLGSGDVGPRDTSYRRYGLKRSYNHTERTTGEIQEFSHCGWRDSSSEYNMAGGTAIATIT